MAREQQSAVSALTREGGFINTLLLFAVSYLPLCCSPVQILRVRPAGQQTNWGRWRAQMGMSWHFCCWRFCKKMTPEHHNVFPRSLGKLLMVALPGLSFGARRETRFLFCKILGLKTNKQKERILIFKQSKIWNPTLLWVISGGKALYCWSLGLAPPPRLIK